jgi:hypothetical protein
MSGELELQAEWTPQPQPVERPRPKPAKELPRTWPQVLLAGLVRFTVILVILFVLAALVALLAMHFTDAEAARAFPLTFYLGGAVIIVGAVLGATSGPSPDWMPEGGYSREEREQGFSSSFAFVAFGVALLGIGVLLDSVL